MCQNALQNSSFEEKIDLLEKKFQTVHSAEERYRLLMDLGNTLPPLDLEQRIEKNLVSGCQSTMYLSANLIDGKIFFYAHSDALISSGLAALLIQVYSDENPAILLSSAPTFLQNLGIHASLSPNRAHGMLRIYLKMKELAKEYDTLICNTLPTTSLA